MSRPCRFLTTRLASAFRNALRVVDVAAVGSDGQGRRASCLEHHVLEQYNRGGVNLHQILVDLQSEQEIVKRGYVSN